MKNVAVFFGGESIEHDISIITGVLTLNSIDKGYKVAICEQLEDPKNAKGIVKRGIVQVISSGTITNGDLLNEKENNF